MATATDTTHETFEHDVIKRSMSVPILVDFWASWCGPCKMLAPLLDDVVSERAGQIEMVKVDVDREPDLVARFHVKGIPAVKLFRDGNVVDDFTGVRSRTAIEAFIDAHLGPTKLELAIDQLRTSGNHPEIVEAFELDYHEQALEHMMTTLNSSTTTDRDEIRDLMLATFEHLGQGNVLATRYRRRLAQILH